MERSESSRGMPFISISIGIVTSRSISSGAWPGHCVIELHVRRREIRIGVNRQFAEGVRAPQHERQRRHDNHERLFECEGDNAGDHIIRPYCILFAN